MDLLDRKMNFKFLWVTEFPLLEFNEELGRFQAMHHPFTMPMEEDIPLIWKVIRDVVRATGL